MGWSEKKINEIFDGEFFTIASQQNDIINVRCVSCGNDAPLLRSSCKSNGNILKHIQRRHPELLDIIRQKKNIKSRGCSDRRSQARLKTPNSESKDNVHLKSGGSLTQLNEARFNTVAPDESFDKNYIQYDVPAKLPPTRYAYGVHNISDTDQRHDTELQLVEPDELCEAESNIYDECETVGKIEVPEEEASLDHLEHEITEPVVLNGECDDSGDGSGLNEAPDIDAELGDCDLLTLQKRLVKRKLEVVEEQHELKLKILQNELQYRRVEHYKTMEYLRRKYEK